MKLKNRLVFLMAFVMLMIQQPAAAIAAEHDTAPAGREQAEYADGQAKTESAEEQAETGPADGQADKKETDNITDKADGSEPAPGTSEELPDNPLPDSSDEKEQEKEDGDLSGNQSEESNPVEDGKNQGTEGSETKEPETEKPETEEPETEKPETGEPETEEPETEKPEKGEPETEKPETEETETEKSETEKSGTEKLETEEPETEETETEGITAAEDEDAESEAEESRIVLELPMLEDYGFCPFDFIMDPQGLITATNAAKYGGAKFEEGATFYFKNTDGHYDYSHRSDWQSIISRSNVPVRVTVTLTVEETYGVDMIEDTSFSDDGSCSMYLALLDGDGNETAVGAEGKAVLQMELPACENEEDEVVCSFALTGCCNPYGDWFGMAECPRITVDWTVEPMILEEEGYVH